MPEAGGTPPGDAPRRERIETVEELVRRQLATALGGKRGIVEAAVPTAVFTVSFLITDALKTSLVLSIGITGVLLLVRVVQRQTVQFVVNALIGIGIAALFASRSGEARDVFLPGILYNGGYAALMLLSVAVGWPLVGFMVGSLTGEVTEWRRDPAMVRLCRILTLVLAVPCVLRVVVQYPLYAADQVTALGATKLALGWPLQVAALSVMVWMLSRNRTPVSAPTD